MGMCNLVRLLTLADRALRVFEIAVLTITGVIILYALLYGALVRYFIKGSFPEEAELCWLMFTWMVLIGSSYASSVGDHPSVTTFKSKMGKLYNVAIYLVGIITMSLFLYGLLRLPSFFWERLIAPTLGLKQVYFYAPILIGGILWIVRYVIKILVMLCPR